jgi:hypothetical protein
MRKTGLRWRRGRWYVTAWNALSRRVMLIIKKKKAKKFSPFLLKWISIRDREA